MKSLLKSFFKPIIKSPIVCIFGEEGYIKLSFMVRRFLRNIKITLFLSKVAMNKLTGGA